MCFGVKFLGVPANIYLKFLGLPDHVLQHIKKQPAVWCIKGLFFWQRLLAAVSNLHAHFT